MESQSNLKFILYSNVVLFCSVLSLLAVHLLLLQSGDIHRNPAPSSIASDTSDSSSSSILNSINLSRHLSFVHYNIQSIVPKLDTLIAELSDFDILAFSETWLNPTITCEELFFLSYHPPERKDRVGDSHGGVVLYVKDTLHYIRRHDLEPAGIECLWIEVNLKPKKILFGLFYRPPNSDSVYFSAIEDSIYLAVDTGIKDIVITGDFNYNMQNIQSSAKIKSLCEQFSLIQTINDSTHFTEHSHSLIDIILTNNVNHLVLSGVGDPFLNQDIRYHCPIFGIFNFSKCKRKSYLRHTWSYDRGDYALLRQKATETNWENLYDPDVHKHAQNISHHII
ncbi:MAG: endonuclease/exonuclease/phosphatase family protein, partial [Candidatus Thiodiazotropha sp.]